MSRRLDTAANIRTQAKQQLGGETTCKWSHRPAVGWAYSNCDRRPKGREAVPTINPTVHSTIIHPGGPR
ncbi:hypothetical protein WCLP8_2780010 [uncultured Gammaproteobacteria bacterium]